MTRLRCAFCVILSISHFCIYYTIYGSEAKKWGQISLPSNRIKMECYDRQSPTSDWSPLIDQPVSSTANERAFVLPLHAALARRSAVRISLGVIERFGWNKYYRLLYSFPARGVPRLCCHSCLSSDLIPNMLHFLVRRSSQLWKPWFCRSSSAEYI